VVLRPTSNAAAGPKTGNPAGGFSRGFWSGVFLTKMRLITVRVRIMCKYQEPTRFRFQKQVHPLLGLLTILLTPTHQFQPAIQPFDQPRFSE
jgi:hypothetical protein